MDILDRIAAYDCSDGGHSDASQGSAYDLLADAKAEIERLRIGQALIARQVGCYKPETPDIEFVEVQLGVLRGAMRCDPPPYPWDAD